MPPKAFAFGAAPRRLAYLRRSTLSPNFNCWIRLWSEVHLRKNYYTIQINTHMWAVKLFH